MRQLDADERLGRIAAAFTASSGLCRAHGAQPHDFVALLGVLLLAACLLRRIRSQQPARGRQLTALRRQWQHAAAAVATSHRPHPVVAPQHFRVVLA